MTSQELKNSILQYAIQGKLVPQNPNDEPASELLKRIKAEKEQLILANKIKKEKALQPTSEEEIPFEIPESWEWVKLLDICKLITDGEHLKPSLTNQGIPLLTAKNITENKVSFENIDFISDDDAEKSWKRCNPQINDILVCSRGTIGRNTLVTEDIRFCLMATVILIKPLDSILPKYLNYYIKSFYSQHILQNMCGSTAVSALYLKDIKELFITLPPLAEQQRIVAKIEELMPLVEEYGKAEAELKNLNKAFPEQIKKSVLQYAIQGKLVSQNPQDEPASLLLAKIKAEKEKSFPLRGNKKGALLPPITEDEIPFEIPENWEWVRFAEVIDVRDGTHDSPIYVDKGYPLITGKDFYNGYFDLSKTKFISEQDYLKIIQRSKVDEGDILYSMIGGNIGSMILIEDYFEMAIKNVALFKRYCANSIEPKYLMIYLKAQLEALKSQSKGGAQQFVPLNILRAYPFALPPLSEQKRIVEKVNEVLGYCEKLK